MPLTRFRQGSKNARLAELLLDGQEHDRTELAEAVGASVNAVPYVVKQLRLAGHNVERLVDDDTGRVRYRVIRPETATSSDGGAPAIRARSPLGEEALTVTIRSLHLDGEVLEVQFTMTGWGNILKVGQVHVEGDPQASGQTLSVGALTGTLDVQEVLFCPDGQIGLRVGNEHGTIDIINVRDDD